MLFLAIRRMGYKEGGTAKATKVFSTKGDAVEFAREISHKQGVEIVIHGHDVRIMSTHCSLILMSQLRSLASIFSENIARYTCISLIHDWRSSA